MIISLLHFDSEIDPQIVSRGMSYYRKGAVIELEQDGENWHVVVAGSDEYAVDVLVNNGKIIRCNCTCPYDFGSFCKHEVAVFYSIRDGVKTVKIRKAKMTTLVTPQTNAQITHLREFLNLSKNAAMTVKAGDAIAKKYPHIKAQNLATNEKLAEYFRNKLKSGNVFFTLGAGDIYEVFELLDFIQQA
jgi:uncharacterized Zn finger protein